MDNSEYRYLSLCDGYLDKRDLWFSNCSFNALCKLNLDSFDVEIVNTFERRAKWERTLHRKIIEYNNFFYFIPNSGTEIDIVNRETGEQSFIKIPKKYLQNDEYIVADALKNNEFIWIFPVYAQQPVIIYDIHNQCFYEEKRLTKRLKEFGGTVFTYKSIYMDDSYLWLVILRTNCVISFDLNKRTIEEYRLDMDNLYSVNYKDGEEIWLGTWDTGSIAIWNYKSNEIRHVVENLQKLYLNAYFNPIIIGDKICVISKEEGKYPIKEGRTLVRIVPDIKKKGSGDLPYIFSCIDNHEVLIFPYRMKHIIRFDMIMEKVSFAELKLPESFVIDNYYECYKLPFLKNEIEKGAINETNDISIKDLIGITDIKPEMDDKIDNINLGEIIWDALEDRK